MREEHTRGKDGRSAVRRGGLPYEEKMDSRVRGNDRKNPTASCGAPSTISAEEKLDMDGLYSFSQFVKLFGRRYGVRSRQTLYKYRDNGRLKVCKNRPSVASGREYLHAIENRWGVGK